MTACVCLMCPAGFGEFCYAPLSNPTPSKPACRDAGMHTTHWGHTRTRTHTRASRVHGEYCGNSGEKGRVGE